MKSAPHKFRPALRLAAVGSLTLWLLAVAYCSADCQDGCSKPEHILPAAAPGAGPHQSTSHDDSLCDSLHSVCPISPALALVRPHFGLAAILNFVSPAQTAASVLPEAPFSRQPPDRGWVFTPEVSLGPAFRSLAPPFSPAC